MGRSSASFTTTRAARSKLIEQQGGEAVGALHHPSVGDIDLVWGKPGKPWQPGDDGYGLAHVIAKHGAEFDVNRLQELLDDMRAAKDQKYPDRMELESEKYHATVRLSWDKSAKKWLLTTFERRPPSPRGTSVVPGTPTGGETSPSPEGGQSPLPSGSGAPDTSVARGGAGVKAMGSQYAGSGLGALEPFFRESTAESGRVTHLRKMMLEELERRNYSQSTTRTYLRTVEDFARYFHRRPDQLGPAHIREYQAHLFSERKLAPNTVTQRLAALRFFFIKTLRRSWSTIETPYPKKVFRLPAILSQKEMARLIDSADTLYHRTVLMTSTLPACAEPS